MPHFSLHPWLLLVGAVFGQAPPAADPAPTDTPPPVETRWTGASGVVLVRVEPGTFTMGSPSHEASREPDERQHEVRITRPFWLGEVEVSQALWTAVTGTSPFEADFKGVPLVGPTLPAQNVTWLDAVRFCNALSARDGLPPAYTLVGDTVTWDRASTGYRLPTEAEWEFAARAGSDRAYLGARGAGSLCATSNVADQAARKRWSEWTGAVPCNDGYAGPSPVGALQASDWGLHDLSGNVGEWTWDLYGVYPDGPVDDPVGAAQGPWRVSRGGAWANNGAFNRLARRNRREPTYKDAYTGLRVARSIP